MNRPTDYYSTTPAGAAQVNRLTQVETWADEPQPAELDAPFTSACVDPCGDYCWGCQVTRRWSA